MAKSRTHEHVQLAELDPLDVVEVARRAQHDEERLAVALELRALVALARVFDGERMQAELLGDGVELGIGRPVEADPREAAVLLARLEGLLEGRRRGDARAVAVDRIVDDRHCSESATRPGEPGFDRRRDVSGTACVSTQECMAIAAAALALSERVDPNCVISTIDVGGLGRLGRQPRTLLAEEQHATLGPREGLDRHGTRHVVDRDDRQACLVRPGREPRDIRVVLDVLVAVGDHRAALVPATAADDVHGVGGERVGAAHDRPDVHVVLPVLDGDVERVPVLVEVGDDRVHAPVPVAVDDVAGVAVLEQLGIVVRVGRPLGLAAGPRADAVRRRGLGRRFGFHPARVPSASARARRSARGRRHRRPNSRNRRRIDAIAPVGASTALT